MTVFSQIAVMLSRFRFETVDCSLGLLLRGNQGLELEIFED